MKKEETILNFIINSNKNIKEKILKSIYFRKKILSSFYHNSFLYLVDNLKDEELLYLLDDRIVTPLINNDDSHEKIKAIILCSNMYKNSFLIKEKILSYISNNYRYFSKFLNNLDVVFGQAFFDYLIKNNNIFKISSLNKEVQYELVKEKTNIQKIIENKMGEDFLSNLDCKVSEYLIENDKYFYNTFINSNILNITNMIENGITLPISMQKSDLLINKYLEIDDVTLLLKYLIELEVNNLTLKEEIKNKLINNYNNKLISNEKFNEEELLNAIIVLNYEEISFNFLKNVENMLNFILEIDKVIVPKQRIIRYKKLYNFFTLSKEEQIALYYEILNDKNSMSYFYDDFRNSLDYSFKMIKDGCLDIKKDNGLVKNTKNGIDVYELEGQKFLMLVNHTLVRRDNIDYSNIWDKDILFASLSLIGDTYMGTYRDTKKYIVLGFTSFDYKNIAHVYHSDSFSLKQRGSERIIDILSPYKLLDNTRGYNEILMKNSNMLSPSYIVCFDDIKEGDIKASKYFNNIPIVLIHTDKYKVSKKKVDYNFNNYISYSELDSNKRRK